MDRRNEINKYLNANGGKITLDQAVDVIGASYYSNARFHVGNVLSRMVKSGKLTRIRPGVFERRTEENKPTRKVSDPDQLDLF
jgi:hypothetical protein